MEIAGYCAGIVMGFVLGAIGGGGSILTVPLLVYLFQFDAVTATGYSLFIVGCVAAVGALQYGRAKQVDLKTGAFFAIPSVMGVYASRRYIVPSLPPVIANFGSFALTRDMFILIVFALVMLVAAVAMIRKRREKTSRVIKNGLMWIALDGVVVGLVTGFVGAGGGFLIVPALVLLARLPMKTAVGTSLTIIATNSLLGFSGDIQTRAMIDWSFLFSFTLVSIIGIFLGFRVAKRISGAKLKPIFGWFVLIMAILMLFKELSTS